MFQDLSDLGVGGWLSWTKPTKHQNSSPKCHTLLTRERAAVRKITYSLFSPALFSPWSKSTQEINYNQKAPWWVWNQSKESLVRWLESLMASGGWGLMKPSPLEYFDQLFKAASGLSSEFYAHQLPPWLTHYFFDTSILSIGFLPRLSSAFFWHGKHYFSKVHLCVGGFIRCVNFITYLSELGRGKKGEGQGVHSSHLHQLMFS